MQQVTRSLKGKDCPTFGDPDMMAVNVIEYDRQGTVDHVVKLMCTYSDKVVMCPYNPGGHYVLIAFSFEHNVISYLDSNKPTGTDNKKRLTHDYSIVKAIIDE